MRENNIKFYPIIPTIFEIAGDTIKLNCGICNRKNICDKYIDKAELCEELMNKLSKGEQ